MGAYGLPIAAGVLLAAAIGLRVGALGLDGHTGDAFVIARWAETMAEVGPWGFYERDGSIYPALLYLYWPMGELLDGQSLDLAIKGSSIPFDVAVGALLFVVVRSLAGAWHGLAAAALYLLNPAVLIAGPMWGQIDAAGTLCFLAALVAVARSRYATAGALAVLAGLVKPQFGLVLLPVAFVAVRDWSAARASLPGGWPRGAWLRGGWKRRPVLGLALGGLATYLLVAAPLRLDPLRLVSNVAASSSQPFASVSAPNPWALLVGYRVPDGAFVFVGVVLLLAGVVAAMLPLLRRRGTWTLLAVGALVAFAFYFLPTRVHERYLFPAFALLAPFAAISIPSLAAYAALSLAFAASLVASLTISMSRTVGVWAPAELLQSSASAWVMGLTLATAALFETWLLVRLSRRFDVAGDTGEASPP